MFLRVVERKHGNKVYKYAFIVENVRTGAKVSQRYVKNLGKIENETDWNRAKELFGKIKLGEDIVTVKEIEIERNEEYGSILAVKHVWNALGCDEIFPDKKFGGEIFALVANRLSNPESENKTMEWIQHDAYIEGKDGIKLHNLYRALDFLAENKEALEKSVFERLGLKDLKIVFYDLTSSYFESRTEDELRKFGYSRDKKRGKRQIAVGLVLADGLPIAHFVFPGNTLDKDTLEGTVKYLGELGITNEQYVFVADRGLIDTDNLEFIEGGNGKYIIATKRRRDKFVKPLMTLDATEGAREVHSDGNGRRYVLCFSRERQKEDSERLEFEIKAFRELLSKDAGKAKQVRGRRALLKRLFDESFSFNQKAYEYEKAICGKFLLVTNTSGLSAEECMKSYRQLAEIERNFREIKSFVKLRPFYHRDAGRIRAHVFVCVLALLMEKLMEKKLDKSLTMISARAAMDELKRVRVSFCRLNGTEVRVLNKLSGEQEAILESLGIEKPGFVV